LPKIDLFTRICSVIHSNGWYHGRLLIVELAHIISEHYLTFLTIKRNCDSVQHVCLSPNVNIPKCLKIRLFLSYFKTRASKPKFISQTRSSVQAVFFLHRTLKAPRNAANGRKSHNATIYAAGEFFRKIILFNCWTYPPRLTII
jgi:hypothetical protein